MAAALPLAGSEGKKRRQQNKITLRAACTEYYPRASRFVTRSLPRGSWQQPPAVPGVGFASGVLLIRVSLGRSRTSGSPNGESWGCRGSGSALVWAAERVQLAPRSPALSSPRF